MTAVIEKRVTALPCAEKVSGAVVTETITAAVQLDKTVAVVVAGTQGPVGRRGLPGPAGGSAFIRIAGEPISALRAVYELPSGAVHPLSADDAEHIDLLAGITITSASAGQEITVQRSGPLDASGLNLQPGRVWLGMDGALTQTPPATGFDTLLGYATAEQRLYIDISETILLED